MGYDIKADIYSIGITCCELSNGCIPFAHLEASEMLLNKLCGETPRPIDSKDINELQENNTNLSQQLTSEMSAKFEKYKQKVYTKQFLTFTVEACLHPEPHKRLNASQLLRHEFITKYANLDKKNIFKNY